MKTDDLLVHDLVPVGVDHLSFEIKASVSRSVCTAHGQQLAEGCGLDRRSKTEQTYQATSFGCHDSCHPFATPLASNAQTHSAMIQV